MGKYTTLLIYIVLAQLLTLTGDCEAQESPKKSGTVVIKTTNDVVFGNYNDHRKIINNYNSNSLSELQNTLSLIEQLLKKETNIDERSRLILKRDSLIELKKQTRSSYLNEFIRSLPRYSDNQRLDKARKLMQGQEYDNAILFLENELINIDKEVDALEILKSSKMSEIDELKEFLEIKSNELLMLAKAVELNCQTDSDKKKCLKYYQKSIEVRPTVQNLSAIGDFLLNHELYEEGDNFFRSLINSNVESKLLPCIFSIIGDINYNRGSYQFASVSYSFSSYMLYILTPGPSGINKSIEANNFEGIANTLLKSDLRDSALFHFKKAVSSWKSFEKIDSIKSRDHQMACLDNIGEIYSKTGKSDSALTYYYHVLDLAYTLIDTMPSIYMPYAADIRLALGELLGEKQDKSESIYNYKEAAEIYEIGLEIDHNADSSMFIPKLAKAYYGLGFYYRTLDSALKYYNKSLALYMRLRKTDSSKYKYKEACLLNNIGNLYVDAEKTQLAIPYFIRAGEIAKDLCKTDSSFNFLFAQIFENHINTLNKGKIYTGLREKLEDLLKIYTHLQNSETSHFSKGRILSNLAFEYYRSGSIQTAIKIYQDALHIYLQIPDGVDDEFRDDIVRQTRENILSLQKPRKKLSISEFSHTVIFAP